MLSFFFRELQLVGVSLFVSYKLCVEFPIFDSVLFLLKFILLFNKMHELFDFKTWQPLSKLK